MYIEKLIHRVYEMEYDALRNNAEYQRIRETQIAGERELVMALTRKQRVMFHECMRQRDELAVLEVTHLLSRCTLLIPPHHRATPAPASGANVEKE